MIEALVLACLVSSPDCNVWNAERYQIVRVPKATCTMQAMTWAAQTEFLKPGETLKIKCEEKKA